MKLDLAVAAHRMDEVLSAESTRGLVAAYFRPDSTFAGATFDTFRTSTEARNNEITSDDLVAITLLDVSCTPTAVRKLFGSHRARLTELFRTIPADQPLWEREPETAAAMLELRNVLRSEVRIGYVTTTKLMARKRPHLVPIFDSVVSSVLGGWPTWQVFQTLLEDEDRRNRIEALRGADSAEVSLLRLLDVALWMSGSASKSVGQARLDLKSGSDRA